MNLLQQNYNKFIMDNKLKAIIFDYDGVIAESLDIKTEAFKTIFKPFGKNIVEKVSAHHISNGGISRFEKFKLYYNKYLGKQIDDQTIIELSFEFSKLVVQKVIDAPYVDGALNFIKKNHKYFDLYISTGTPENEIKEILYKKNINNYFKTVYGSPETKINHVKKIINQKKYNKSEVIFIGDAESDIKAAMKNSIKIIFRRHSDNSFLLKKYKLVNVENLNNLEKVIENMVLK